MSKKDDEKAKKEKAKKEAEKAEKEKKEKEAAAATPTKPPERTDAVGEWLLALGPTGWPSTISNKERERRRRLVIQAQEPLCSDNPFHPLDHFKLFPHVHCIAHITHLASFYHHLELIQTIITRAFSELERLARLESDKQQRNSPPPPATAANQSLGTPGTPAAPPTTVQVIENFLASLWAVFQTHLDEKKIAKDEQYCVQAAALGALTCYVKTAAAERRRALANDAKRGGGKRQGNQQGGSSTMPNFNSTADSFQNAAKGRTGSIDQGASVSLLKLPGLSPQDAERCFGLLQPLTVSLPQAQRFEKRGFSDSKSAFEDRYEGLALLRVHVLALAMEYHFLWPEQFPLANFAPWVAESGYKGRDLIVSRAAVDALARGSDLGAILAVADRLPARFDPVNLSQIPTKQSMKSEWQNGGKGHLQLWDHSTAVSVGRLCCRAMSLCEERGTECPREFFVAFSILLHHPRTSVFLACCCSFVECVTAAVIRLCRAPDPVYNSSGSQSTMDHLFDRLLGSCATLSQCELLSTLAMVERFTERAFEQKLNSEVIRPSWFSTLPSTLSTIWEKHSNVFGIVLAAVRVWGALLLLERCLVAPSAQATKQPPSSPTSSGPSSSGTGGGFSSLSAALESSSESFFRFILHQDVIRALHIAHGNVMFDIIEHFIRQLGGSASTRLTPLEVSLFLRRSCAVLIEASFMGCPERRCMSTVSTRSAQVIRTLLELPHLSPYRNLIFQCGLEIIEAAECEGSQEIAQAVRMVLGC